MSEIKSTVKISDELKIDRVQGGEDDRFTIELKDEFYNHTQTIRLYSKEEAIALAKELMIWAESQA